jgi:cell wall-associated NlpC family hydrolase
MLKIRERYPYLSSSTPFLLLLCFATLLFFLPSCGGGQNFSPTAFKSVKSKGSRINSSIQDDMHSIRPSSLVAPGARVTDVAEVAALDDPYMVSYGYQTLSSDGAALSENAEQLIDPFVAVRGLGGRLWTTRAGESLAATKKKLGPASFQANNTAWYVDDAPSSYKALKANKGVTTTVLTQAYGQTGKPYKTGAASPEKGFDNTSFVTYVFSQAGYKLSSKSPKDIIAGGKSVAKDELRPGDIMVYRDPKSAESYMLGIYSGNGNFLLASSRFNIITETAAFGIDYGPYFVGGRRYYDDPDAQPLPESMKMAVTNGAVKAALAELSDQPSFQAATKINSVKSKKKAPKKVVKKKKSPKAKAKTTKKKSSAAKK